MKMEPDLFVTLSASAGPTSDSLLTFGDLFPEQKGNYFLMDLEKVSEESRGQVPGSDLVLLPPETPPQPSVLLGPVLQETASVAFQQVLGEVKLHQDLFSEGPIKYLYRLENQELCLLDQETNTPVADINQDLPVSDKQMSLLDVVNKDSSEEDFNTAITLVQDPVGSDRLTGSEEPEQEDLYALDLGPPRSPPQDLQLSIEFREQQSCTENCLQESDDILQDQRDFYLGMDQAACPDPKTQLSGLDPVFSWTKEPEDYVPGRCQKSVSLSAEDLNHSYQISNEINFFPSFTTSTLCDLKLDIVQNNLGQSSDFNQTEPIPNEPSGCQEDVPRLRAVFDALDRDGDGFVRIEEFVQFATVYGAEQVKDLTKYLDPSGLGIISFEDFYRGITAISNGDPESQLYDIGYVQEDSPACPDEFDDFVTYEANEVTDSAYMGSESTYSECETFTDEDTSTLVQHEMHNEVETDSAIDSAGHSECPDGMEEPENGPLLLTPDKSRPHDLSLSSDLNNSIVTVISGEEHFEDYGEGNEAELFSDNLCNGEASFSSSFLSPSTNPLAAKLHSILTDEAFEFYCSQCHKQINRLEDLSARLNDLEMNSPNKRLSSKKVARHLHQTGTLTVEAMEEPSRDAMDCTEEDIADKVIFLEKRVTELEKDTVANGEQHSRLKQENLQLVHRANALEEQLKEQELRADEMILEEIRKQKELLCKMEREKSIEIENLQARLQQLDDENSELRSCTPCLKANIERLEEEKQKLLDEIEDLTIQLNEEQENKRKMGDKLSHERHQFQKDKESTQELIEDLRKQLEHLQLFKLEAEQRRGRSSSTGLQEYNSRTRETELEQEIRRLKQDNRNLKEQNDELNGQIINLSIQGAKNLFSASFSESLAAEISSVSRDELMEAIQKQEEINFRLQDYIDRIIVAIMETNPSILEVK